MAKISKRNLFGALGMAIVGIFSLFFVNSINTAVGANNNGAVLEQFESGMRLFVELTPVNYSVYVLTGLLLVVAFFLFAKTTFTNTTSSPGLDIAVATVSGIITIGALAIALFSIPNFSLESNNSDYVKAANDVVVTEAQPTGASYETETANGRGVLTLETNINGGQLMELEVRQIQDGKNLRVYYTPINALQVGNTGNAQN